MTRIVSIGECMVELSPTPTPGQFRLGYAGDTLNTAWYLRRLLPKADQVDYFTAVGTDRMSGQMLDFLNDAGIGTDKILRRSDRTVGLYLIQLDKGERSFAYWRGQSAARGLADDAEVLRAALQGADMAYLSGITLAILPPEGRKTLLAVLQEFRASGGQVIFDPNLRPKLWATPEEMRATITAAARVAGTILPSFEDEALWFGDTDPEATAARYRSAGAACVVVKNGPGEILVRSGDEDLVVPALPCDKVVDTTAAGDSFNAGFLAGRRSGGSLAEAVAKGAALSAHVISHFGALVPLKD